MPSRKTNEAERDLVETARRVLPAGGNGERRGKRRTRLPTPNECFGDH